MFEIDKSLKKVKKDKISYKYKSDLKSISISSQNESNTIKIGEISASYVWLYPPGVPLLVPGEVVSQEFFSFVKSYEKHYGKSLI